VCVRSGKVCSAVAVEVECHKHTRLESCRASPMLLSQTSQPSTVLSTAAGKTELVAWRSAACTEKQSVNSHNLNLSKTTSFLWRSEQQQ
jgi:hypothetical protein